VRKKNLVRNILFLLIFLVVIIVVFEVLFRVAGFKPDLQAVKPTVTVEPEGSFFQADSNVGYINQPGRYLLHFPYNYACVCTHDSEGHRITRPIQENEKYSEREQVWIFGCSNTYGWSLNDWQAYPYKLQQMNPSRNVISYAVTGFGTVQSLLQLQVDLQNRPPPSLVILAYFAMHDRRNIMSASRRKSGTVYNYLGPMVQPYAYFDKHDSLVINKPIDIEYNRVPLSGHSSLVHFVERAVNTILFRLSNSQDVSLALILEMDKLCKAHNIPFVVAGIAEDNRTSKILSRCAERGLLTVDISLSNHSGVFSNDPYDGHPNAIANSYYAGKLNQFLHDKHLIPE